MTAEGKILLVAAVSAVQLACVWRIARAPVSRARQSAALIGVALASAVVLFAATEVWK